MPAAAAAAPVRMVMMGRVEGKVELSIYIVVCLQICL